MFSPKSLEKRDISDIANKTKCFLNNRKHSNNLLYLISALKSENYQVVFAAQKAVQEIFVHLIHHNEMFLEKPVTEYDLQEKTIEEKYRIWLQERYKDCKIALLDLFYHDKQNIQELALCTLMKFSSSEGLHPVKPIKQNKWYFPTELLKELLEYLLTNEKNLSQLIGRFKEFLEYEDVKYYTLISVLSIIKMQKSKIHEGSFLENTFAVISQIHMSNEENHVEGLNTLVQVVDKKPDFLMNCKNIRKQFSLVWMEFLKCKLPIGLYKKVLILLHDQILPYFYKPLLLTDFLTESYNIGGAVSLLALNGLFFLIQKYNLEYPDFYKKLYALFDLSILYSKYQPRFFFLSDLFLSSTHLPAYLVAAFAKRLSRLSLSAPSNTLLVIIPFIRNLLIRHPGLKILLHNPNSTELCNDPYIPDEPDPAKCKASESSLWELKTLQFHWHPDIQLKAKFIESPVPEIECDLSEILEIQICDMMKKQSRKKFKEVHLSYDKPSGLFLRNEDKMLGLWTIS